MVCARVHHGGKRQTFTKCQEIKTSFALIEQLKKECVFNSTIDITNCNSPFKLGKILGENLDVFLDVGRMSHPSFSFLLQRRVGAHDFTEIFR